MFLSHKFLLNDEAKEATGGVDQKEEKKEQAPVAKTKEQIDAINDLREKSGQEKLPYEHEGAEAEKKGGDEENKIDLQPIKITAKKPEPKPAEKPEGENADELGDEDIEDSKLLKALSKKAGKEITSLEDFINPKNTPTAEDIEAEKDKRESKKISFGLENGIISKKQLEGFIADSKDPTELVFQQYFESQQSIDAELTEKDARDEFERKFNLDEKEESRQYKRGMEEINALAETILKKKYPDVYSLDNEFSSFESEEKQKTELQSRVLSQAPLLKKDVDMVKDKLKKLSFNTLDKEGNADNTYDVDVDDDVLEEYASKILEPDYAAKVIAKGWNLDEMEKGIRNAIIIDNLPTIITGIIEQDRLKTQAGLRGIIPAKEVKMTKLTPEQQQKFDAARKAIGYEPTAN